MSEPRPADDELMDQLRRIAGNVDPVPPLANETAQAAFSTRRLDEELAELLHDSDLAVSQGIRGAGPRMLSFESGAVSLELQLDTARGQLVVRGMSVGTVGDADVETSSTGGHAVPIDERGWFRIDGLPLEPLRVRVRDTSGATVTTGWIRP
jgi:hypothetical protein